MKDRLLILGGSDLQLPLIFKAISMGLSPVVVDNNPNCSAFSISGIAKEKVSTTDVKKVVEIAKKWMVKGITTAATDRPMRSVAAVCSEMNLPGLSRDAAQKSTHKGEMMGTLQSEGIAVAEFMEVQCLEEFLEAIKLMSGDLILKPVDNSGSRGVIKFSSLDSRDTLTECYNYSRSNSISGSTLVMEYLQGREVSAEVLVSDADPTIVAITDKLTTGPPHFVETGHTQPADLLSGEIEKVHQVVNQAIRTLGITNSAAHVEVMITEDGPYVIEVGARLGGDYITSHLVPLSTGVDMLRHVIEISLGKKIKILRKYDNISAVRYFKTAMGQLREIKQTAVLDERVSDVFFFKRPGDLITGLAKSGDRLGCFILHAGSKDELIEVIDKTQKSFIFLVEEEK